MEYPERKAGMPGDSRISTAVISVGRALALPALNCVSLGVGHAVLSGDKNETVVQNELAVVVCGTARPMRFGW